MASVFAVEEIPNEAVLFRRINRHHITPEGNVSSAAYNQDELSVNWSKYSNPESSAIEGTIKVTALSCGECRNLGLTVNHAPIQEGEAFGPNQAHSEICGKKTNSIKNKLRDMAIAVWPVGANAG